MTLLSLLIKVVLLIRLGEKGRDFIATAPAACEGRVMPWWNGEVVFGSILLFFRQSERADGGRAVLAVLA